MLIEVDLNKAKSLKITINQFLLIKLLLSGSDVNSWLDVIPINETDINELIEKDILTKESKYSKKLKDSLIINIKDEQEELLASLSDFDEFYAAYPVSVLRNDGIKDYLRGNVTNCRKLYNKLILNSNTRHSYILECLKFEIANRKTQNSMGYMKRMYKWLTSEEWSVYGEYMKDSKIKKVAANLYGSKVE